MRITALVIALVHLFSCRNAPKGNNGLVLNSEADNKDTLMHLEASSKPTTNSRKPNEYFPFELSEANGKFTISADIESKELMLKYDKFFKKYRLEGNGYCWEGLIKQILQKKDKDLLNHLDFDSEAGEFFVYPDSKEHQQKFAAILSPIFSDLDKL